MILTYQAVDAEGRPSSDSVEAGNTGDALELLRRRGLFVTQISPAKQVHTGATANSAGSPAPGMPLKTLALFTRQMAMLLRAGSGLVPAVMAISRQMPNPRHKALLSSLVMDLEEGSTLTDALRKHPATFDAVYCAIVAAGEASATLSKVFERLALIVGRQRALRKKILGTLAYPCLLITMCTGIIQVLLLFVLPRFADMFEQLGVETPASTQALLVAGKIMRGYWPLLLAGFGALVFGGIAMARTAWGRQWMSNIQIQIPFIGRLRSRLIQGQIFRTMGMLTESKVGLLETLELAGRSTNNNRYRRLFDDLEQAVTSGGLVSTTFEASGLVEPALCQAVHTGEDSGNLSEALTYCADILDETNEELINVFARLMEPVILLGMGVVVGGVAISLFLPLFDLTAAIQ